ncbi:hypothetical protein FBUS_11129 [Fasciolopsis buskii]|uniref:Uncharacterized protein n=1 Tax=Fasciolopsis buskii TaxID=27845 RepID=A0A8E0VFE1_9TREM|nr:hypothetical protein FBUS_11129 [Fasciolopsis buski]
MAAMLRLLPTIFQFANLSASSSDSMSTFNNHKISSPNSVNTFSSMKHSSNYFSDAFSKAHTEINSPTITFHSFDNPEPNKSESRLDFFATATTVPSEDSDFCLYDILRLDKKSGTIGLQNIKTTDAPPAHVTSAQYSTTLKEAAARILDVRILTQVTLFQDDIDYFRHNMELSREAIKYVKGVARLILKKTELLESHLIFPMNELCLDPVNLS